MILSYQPEKQEASLLCWAAVAVSIARFYDPSLTFTQHELATEVFGKKNYNHPLDPRQALQLIGNLREYRERSLTCSEIVKEIENHQPVAACMRYFIGWHLVVIYGIKQEEQLLVADPIHGPLQCSYPDFCHSWLGHYHWTHTCLIQSHINSPSSLM